MLRSLQAAVAAARRHGDLYFAALLDRDCILDAFGPTSSLWQGWIYTPVVTIWVFLSAHSQLKRNRESLAENFAWGAVAEAFAGSVVE
jgi:hypothetical protein